MVPNNCLEMKVKAAVKLICPGCYHVRRGKYLYLRCKTNPRHKRRQGFSTLNFIKPAASETFSLHSLPIESLDYDCQAEAHDSCSNCQRPMPMMGFTSQILEIQRKFAEFDFSKSK